MADGSNTPPRAAGNNNLDGRLDATGKVAANLSSTSPSRSNLQYYASRQYHAPSSAARPSSPTLSLSPTTSNYPSKHHDGSPTQNNLHINAQDSAYTSSTVDAYGRSVRATAPSTSTRSAARRYIPSRGVGNDNDNEIDHESNGRAESVSSRGAQAMLRKNSRSTSPVNELSRTYNGFIDLSYQSDNSNANFKSAYKSHSTLGRWRVPWLQPFGGLPTSTARRKRSSPPPSIISKPNASAASFFTTGKAVGCCLFILCLLYFLIPPKQPSLEPSTNTAYPSSQLPLTKWWLPKKGKDARSGHNRKGQAKRTSFVVPKHTFSDLQTIPSRYFPSPIAVALSVAKSSTKQPSVSAFIDCTSLPTPIDSPTAELLNNYVQELSHQSITPKTIHLLIHSVANSQALRLPVEKSSSFSIHIIPSHRTHTSISQVLGSDVFHQIESDYVLLLSCPVTSSPDQSDTFKSAALATQHFIEHLLRAAGADLYSSSILSVSGLTVTPDRRAPAQFRILGRTLKYSEKEQGAESYLCPLDETVALSIPVGCLFIHTDWLSTLPESLEEEANARHTAQIEQFAQEHKLGLIGLLGMALRSNLGLRIWGLPIPWNDAAPLLPLVHQLQASDTETIREILNIRADSGKAGQVADDGSPARVAVILTQHSATSTALLAQWSPLICGFSQEEHFGHSIRVFSISNAFVGAAFEDCPEVSVEELSNTKLKVWRPDVLFHNGLSAGVDLQKAVKDCTIIEFDVEQEMDFVTWLPSLPVESLQNWHVPRLDIVVVTNDRPASLHRLLVSLRSAAYLSDSVALFVNLDQTADPVTASLLSEADWPFGLLTVRHRIVKGGLMPAIVESWYPSDNDTYGILLEDDIEISPHFYAWLKFSILYHRYGTEQTRENAKRLFGVSLYQPRNIELRPEGRIKFDAHALFADMDLPSDLPYLSQIPCSWGAVYFPEVWREFHHFLVLRLSELAMDLNDVIIPDIRSNRWPKSWKRYLNELIYLRGYTMLYPNYEDFKSLSTNHLELGTHVKDLIAAQKRRIAFEVPLLEREDSLLDGLPQKRLPHWDSMPVIDFWGSVVTEEEIIERAETAKAELGLCRKADLSGGNTASTTYMHEDSMEPATGNSLEASHGTSVLTFDANELLCPREALVPVFYGSGPKSQTTLEREAALAEREADLREREMKILDWEQRHFGQAAGEEEAPDVEDADPVE